MMKIITCWLILCGCYLAYAQAPPLERRITLQINGERLDISLKKVGDAAGVTFSYNPSILTPGKIVRFNFVDKSVREILDEIFKGTVQYKARGKYIILTEATRSAINREPAVVAGYVVDEATGERLKNVSIYEPVTLTSTITDSYGYFEIKIDKPPAEVILSVNRENYSDTLVVVHHRERLVKIRVKIRREVADVGEKVRSLLKKPAPLFDNANLHNIDDTIHRRTQVSFLPFVGTNHRMSAHVINEYSFNILGGYSLGVTKLEAGGLFNLLRGDAHGVQLAGLINRVDGGMGGIQFAGVLNSNGHAAGAQFAGSLNVNADSSQTLQLAGVGNVTAGDQTGPQFAGVFNINAAESGPFQLAGVYNVAAKNVKGFQGAGVFNIVSSDIRGTQFAGVFNFTGESVDGAQIAGVINYAGNVNGLQLGLINISDSIHGIPVGFLSLVWKGYHKIEISADEVFYNNIAFRTGVRQFYNIFTAGARPSTYKNAQTLWTFGYGVGTAPRISRKLSLNFDLTANQVVHGNLVEEVNLLNKLYAGFDYQAFKKISVTIGATLNGHITEAGADAIPSLFSDYHPDILYNGDLGTTHNLKVWIGGKVGVRFL